MGLSINLATGQNAQGMIQSIGDQPDANWTVTNASSYENAPAAYTVAPGDADWNGGWIGNDSSSTWIAANPDSATNASLTTFTIRFNLTGYNPADASIVNGAFTMDDWGTVTLNGHVLGGESYGAWSYFTGYSAGGSDFVAGWNTLVIQLNYADGTYQGARLEGTVVDNVTMGPVEWVKAVNGKFTTAADWQGGAVPATGDDVAFAATGSNYTVTSPADETVNSVQLAANVTLSVIGGTFTASSGTGTGANLGHIKVANATFAAGGTLQNAGGTITADAGGVVALSGATVAGGTLETQGSGVVDISGNPSTFDGMSTELVTKGSVVVQNGSELILDGAIQSSATISVQAGTSATSLEVGQGGATLSGGGSISLSDNPNSAIAASAAGAVLTNVDNTISGSGTIGGNGMGFVNEASGVLDENGANALTLSTTGAVTNAGLIEAIGLGGLTISATIDNAGGTIGVAPGSEITLSGATLAGGTLTTIASGAPGTVNVSGKPTIFDGTAATFTDEAPTDVQDGSQLVIKGTIQNSGTITLEGQTEGASLAVGRGGATLAGNGSIVLSDNANNTIAASSSGAVLTNVESTISGAGTIGGDGLGFTNETDGTVDANGASALTLSTTGAVANAGLLEATGAGNLIISGTTVNNAGGIISAAAGARVILDSADIQGGTIESAGTGAVKATGADTVLDGTASTITLRGRFVVAPNASLTEEGGLENLGVVVVRGTATLSGPVVNAGRIEVAGGTLTAEAAVTSYGEALIAGGGTLKFGATFDQNVIFNGAGTLVLANSRSYSGTVMRFSTSGTDSLDLRDIGFVGPDQASFSGNRRGGVLTVTDGSDTAHITLSGDYLGSTFVTASDSHGGVIVTDPKVSGLIQAVAASSALSSALAPVHAMLKVPDAVALAVPAHHIG